MPSIICYQHCQAFRRIGQVESLVTKACIVGYQLLHVPKLIALRQEFKINKLVQQDNLENWIELVAPKKACCIHLPEQRNI